MSSAITSAVPSFAKVRLAAWQTQEAPQQTIHGIFSRQCRASPKAIALVLGDRRYTYRELDEASDRIAQALLAKGVEPGQPIGLYLPRSAEMIGAMLGALKAGAAYAPLDPADPPERIALLLDEAGIELVLAEGEVPFPIQHIVTLEECAAMSGANPGLAVLPDHAAYVMFTSGSTGRPKAVEIPHRGVVRLVSGDYARFGSDRVFLHLSPPTFDASTFEIWGALLHGGCCVIHPERVPSARGLSRVIRDCKVTTLWLTAALFNVVIDANAAALSLVEEVLVGGETLSSKHVKLALAALPQTQLINGYGPTEATTFTCCYRIPRNFGDSFSTVPIGTPIAGTEVLILDDALNPVPDGVAGEIFIGGSGLALGYRNRPELTAEKFIVHPQSGRRLYRSGDFARLIGGGVIEFLGRRDHQVKIRGNRIELGEIECALEAQFEVAQAAVVAHRAANAPAQLSAFVVLRPESSSLPMTALRDRLRARLPRYMLPNRIVPLPAIPITTNGKVDRTALESFSVPFRAANCLDRAPRSRTENCIADRMEEMLGVRGIHCDDEFCEVGGDSLSAVQLIAWLQDEFGFGGDVPRDLTPASLAAAVDEGPRGAQGGVLMKHGAKGVTPLLFIHGADGYAPLYPAMFHRIDCPIYGVSFSGSDPDSSLEAIAAHHIARMWRVLELGQVRIAGYSFGGILAYEIARQLSAKGIEVSRLILLDAGLFGLQVSWTRGERVRQWRARLRGRLTLLKRGTPYEALCYVLGRARIGVRAAAKRTSVAHEFFEQYIRNDICPNRRPLAARLLQAMERYAPKPYAGDVTLIRAGQDLSGDASFDPQNGWGKLVRGRLTVHNVAGSHVTMLQGANMDAVGRLMQKILSE